jgi:Protein of unknown function (DUF3631)
MSKRWEGDEYRHLFAAFNLMMGSDQQGEAANARATVDRLMKEHDAKASDLMDLINKAKLVVDEYDALRRASQMDPMNAAAGTPPPDPITLLEIYKVIRAMYEQYITMQRDEYMICALWNMHCPVYRQFTHTPRLVLKSLVRDCGKTTTLSVTQQFVPSPWRSDNMTVPSFFRATDGGRTLLLDEIDNQDLLNNSRFRAALNSGYHCDGHFDIRGERFATFAPVVLAGIGTVPLPLSRRSLIIHLKRDPNAPRTRKRFNKNDPVLIDMVDTIKPQLMSALARADLDLDPPMPRELTGGQCDNWRPLISIADACGPEIGELARGIAVKMCVGLDEDLVIILIRDIKDIFDAHCPNRLPNDQIPSALIINDLLEVSHGRWAEWKGLDDRAVPRKFTWGIMAKLLNQWTGPARTVRPSAKVIAKCIKLGLMKAKQETARGYWRQQFEGAFQSYCTQPQDDTSTQPRVGVSAQAKAKAKPQGRAKRPTRAKVVKKKTVAKKTVATKRRR